MRGAMKDLNSMNEICHLRLRNLLRNRDVNIRANYGDYSNRYYGDDVMGNTAGSTAIISWIGMYDALSYTCENKYDPLIPVPNSNDPYVYVDPWTGRIMKSTCMLYSE